MRIFGSERIATIMSKLGAEDGEVISHPIVSRAIANAQKRVEGRNFEIRKHLKEYDDVMNLQRTEIYGLRQRILRGEDLKEDIMDQIAGCLEEIVLKHTMSDKYPENWNLSALYADVQATFGIAYRISQEELTTKTQETLFDDVAKRIRDRYEEKERRFGSPVMRQFERAVFLMVIDNLWKDHLYEMDHLKGGVQYRAFGQKNPLYEYQREGLKMFAELRQNISREVASYLFRLERAEPERQVMPAPVAQEIHGTFDIFSSSSEARPQAPVQRQPELITNRAASGQRTVVNTGQQVGRNDPCPCGSGKKYKKCHGA